MAKKQWELGANDEVALKEDFTLTGGALPSGGYVSSLFSSDNTSLQSVIAADTATAWAASTAYKVNETVSYGGATYICITAHTSASAFDSTKWQAATLGDGKVTAYKTPDTPAVAASATFKMEGDATYPDIGPVDMTHGNSWYYTSGAVTYEVTTDDEGDVAMFILYDSSSMVYTGMVTRQGTTNRFVGTSFTKNSTGETVYFTVTFTLTPETPSVPGKYDPTVFPYGYVTKTGTTITADEAKVNRIATSSSYEYLTAAATVNIPPYEDRVAECILRFSESATAYNVTLGLTTGTVDRYYISGDTVAAGTASAPKQYEMLCQVIPAATSGHYEVISTTRELATSES